MSFYDFLDAPIARFSCFSGSATIVAKGLQSVEGKRKAKMHNRKKASERELLFCK
ncbi:MAG: hypothetical protein ACI35P_03970 [Bacillus sp. (in: firmicutes)]